MHQNAPVISKNLTPKQALALPHIACASSMSQGAELAQVDRSTLRRWMRDDHFRSQLEHLRDEAASFARAKLQALTLKSVLVLADSLDTADEALRLRAARIILQSAAKADDAKELSKRLDSLDDALSMLKAQL